MPELGEVKCRGLWVVVQFDSTGCYRVAPTPSFDAWLRIRKHRADPAT